MSGTSRSDVTGRLVVDHRIEEGSIVVTPAGVLDVSTYAQLRDVLLRCAAEEPAALVVDLDRVQAERVSSLSLFPTVWMRVSSWPDIPLMLVAHSDPIASSLRRGAVPRFVPTYSTVAEALASLGPHPRRRRAGIVLPSVPSSSRRARAWMVSCGAEWGVEVPDAAVLVVSELVENAVEHARSAGVAVRIELRADALSVAVCDDDPHPPQLVPFTSAVGRGRGMAMVDAMARAWGHNPRFGGGKVVWAVVDVPAAARRLAPSTARAPDLAPGP